MNRRSFLRGTTALAGVAIVAACAVNTTNGTTTVTVNTATALAYVSGLAALASAFLGVPGVATALGAALATVETVISDVNAVAPQVNTAANGSASFSFNTTSVPAFVASLEQDAAQLMSYANTALTTLGKNAPASVQTYYNAIVSVANAISALFSISSAAKAVAPSPMSVSAALALVHIKAP